MAERGGGGRRLLIGLVAFLVLALIAFAGWVLNRSTWLDVRQVEVTGLAVESEAAAAEDAAAIPEGTPLFRLDGAAVAARVSQLPPVAAVQVHRRWPHTVEIEVTARTPVLALADGDDWQLVDADGIAFRTVSGAPSGVLRGSIDDELTDSGARAATTAQLATVAAVLRSEAVVTSAVGKRVRSITAASVDSVELTLAGAGRNGRAVTVEWGAATDSELKAEVLEALLGAKENRDARVINVQVPSHPTVR